AVVAAAELAAGVALGGLMVGHLAKDLVHRDAGERLADVFRIVELELAFLGAMEERAEHRLDDVLRVDPAREPLTDPLAGHVDHLVDVLVEYGPARGRVALTKRIDEGFDRIRFHDASSGAICTTLMSLTGAGGEPQGKVR